MLRTFVSHARGSSRALLRLLVAVPPVTAWVFARAGGERAAMVQTTLAVTMLDAGTAVNVLAPVARAHLNLRLAPGETVDGALKRLRRKVRDRQVTIELVAGTDPSPQSPVDGPGYAAVSDAVRLAYPEAVCAPYVMVQATDSRFIHRRVRDVFRFAPLRMTAQQRASIHGVDEYVDIESLERGERFYRALVVGLG